MKLSGTDQLLVYTGDMNHQNVGQNRDLKIADRSFEKLAQFK
jgi:hypothetical protein